MATASADLSYAPVWSWSGMLAREVPVAYLVAGLVGAFVAQNIFLWRFIGFAPGWWYVAGLGLAALCIIFARRLAVADRVPAGRLLALIAVAAALLLLGGEGRLFYANQDWQIRDAVLRDMAVHPWPFAYTARGAPEMLRSPVGMYLFPALASKLVGSEAAGPLLLLQNSLMLGAILALASTLFTSARARLAALGVAIAFSGMDVVGSLLANQFNGHGIPSHVEVWSGMQFSSHIMQIFWAPHHALPGWLLAILYLLWRDGRMSLGPLLAAAPLVALWSPLVVVGILPFAAHAGVVALQRRSLSLADFIAPALATALAAPGLVYMLIDSGATPAGFYHPRSPFDFVELQLLEVAPFLLAGAGLVGRGRFGGMTLAIAGISLFIIPTIQVSKGIDFCMRVSIPALAILCAVSVDALREWVRTPADEGSKRRLGWALAATLTIGGYTGASEISRSLYLRPQWPSQCSLFSAWKQARHGYRDDVASYSVYIAPLSAFPAWMRPEAVAIVDPSRDPRRCFPANWLEPRRLA